MAKKFDGAILRQSAAGIRGGVEGARDAPRSKICSGQSEPTAAGGSGEVPQQRAQERRQTGARLPEGLLWGSPTLASAGPVEAKERDASLTSVEVRGQETRGHVTRVRGSKAASRNWGYSKTEEKKAGTVKCFADKIRRKGAWYENCVNHPEIPVAAYCQNCGKALCATCVRSVAGSSIASSAWRAGWVWVSGPFLVLRAVLGRCRAGFPWA